MNHFKLVSCPNLSLIFADMKSIKELGLMLSYALTTYSLFKGLRIANYQTLV
jgi:hypothetical protein